MATQMLLAPSHCSWSGLEDDVSPSYKPLLGEIFHTMAKLEKLNITFETTVDKARELESIVNWARTWRFDIKSNWHWLCELGLHQTAAYFVYDSMQKWSWRAPVTYWAILCPSCGREIFVLPINGDQCKKRQALLARKKGYKFSHGQWPGNDSQLICLLRKQMLTEYQAQDCRKV